jgi:segregation and condensation protein B
MKPSILRGIIEALLLVSTEPLPLPFLEGILHEHEKGDIQAALQELQSQYAEEEMGIQISLASGGYFFTTNPRYDEYVKRLLRDEKKSKLSRAALETLSIVAYHQPITQAEISSLRGVDASHSLRTLLHKKLIKIIGRKKSPGNPLIYRTTKRFLIYFGLESLEDLPTQEEIEKIIEDDSGDE